MYQIIVAMLPKAQGTPIPRPTPKAISLLLTSTGSDGVLLVVEAGLGTTVVTNVVAGRVTVCRIA